VLVRERARILGVSRHLIWSGDYQADSELPILGLAATDICALPFDGGAQLNNSSIAAAAAFGLPIVTTATESTEPCFDHGRNVWLCPPKDPAALASAVTRLITQESLRRDLAVGARDLAARLFSWPRVVEHLFSLLRP